MTSNLGSTYILEHGSADWAEVEAQVLASLRQHFRPEFLNRVDDVIVFRPLGEEEIGRIIELQLKRLERLLAERKLTIELTPEARAAIATEGYDPAYGARPLKRALQRMVQNPLAMGVLDGRFKDGDHIRVGAGANGGGLTFEVAPRVAGNGGTGADGSGGGPARREPAAAAARRR
jgi:ATP-dependent Clp protease ATP-binding subunit ClpB